MKVDCQICKEPMTLLYQAKDDKGLDTFNFHCATCGGRVGVQSTKAKPPTPRPIEPIKDLLIR